MVVVCILTYVCMYLYICIYERLVRQVIIIIIIIIISYLCLWQSEVGARLLREHCITGRTFLKWLGAAH